MRGQTRNRVLLAAGAAAVVAGVGAIPSGLVANAAGHPAPASHQAGLTSDAPVTVVASGLEAPRDMAWGPDGHLLVSEAGVPTSDCVGSGFTLECFGVNGSIADISSGTAKPIITGLVTAYNEEEMVGPDALTYTRGHLYTQETGAPQEIPSGLPASLTTVLDKQFGALLDVTPHRLSVVANPGNVDYQWSQAHTNLTSDFPDADPYGLAANPRGGFYLADAASNTLDSIDAWGHVQVLAFIPELPNGTDAVPTCVAAGPDGSVYVGELTGHGNSATAASIYRYSPWTGKLTVWQSGFSAIDGCGFGAHGNFYATELDTTGFLPPGNPDGAVIQISPDGTRTVLGAGQLLAPSGFLAGPDGSIYVTNDSIIWPAITGTISGPDSGEVVKIG